MITFKRTLFSPNFWHIYDAFKNPTIRFIWAYGGADSSKTYSIVQCILHFTLTEGTDTIVFRKIQRHIEGTVYKDFKTIINHWSLQRYFTCIKLQIRCVNGAVIDFQGLDDVENIKGITSKRIYCNEINAQDHEDYKQIRKRLRGQAGQQIINDFNPIDELHWIKVNIFDNEIQNPLPLTLNNGIVDAVYTEVTGKWMNSSQEIINPRTNKLETVPPNTIVIHSTYLNNFWAVGSPDGTFGFYDQAMIADFEYDKKHDYNFYRVYALGQWGRLTKGGEFYKKFTTENQVRPSFEYNPNLPLHISFDENVNPYLSLSIYQAQGKRTWKINEICLEHPINTLRHTLDEFRKLYPPNKSGLYIYGDRTSLKEDTKLEKGQNFYSIITSHLQEYDPDLRLPSRNPPVKMRGNFINDIFSGLIEGVSYLIGDNCKNTITDYQYVKEASDGTKLKEKAKHPITKVTYEKYTHLTDTDDYFLCEYFSEEFREYQSGGPIDKPVIGHRRNRRY